MTRVDAFVKASCSFRQTKPRVEVQVDLKPLHRYIEINFVNLCNTTIENWWKLCPKTVFLLDPSQLSTLGPVL